MRTAWKFLNRDAAGRLTSQYDGSAWIVGEWWTVPAPVEECRGLNASRYIQHALNYVKGNALAHVEYAGKTIKSSDKLTCEKMRLTAVYEWTPNHSVKLAIFAARSVFQNWFAKCPDDRRPLDAIEAAESWLKNPAAASAAWAAASAAASAAAWAADSAAVNRKIHAYCVRIAKDGAA